RSRAPIQFRFASLTISIIPTKSRNPTHSNRCNPSSNEKQKCRDHCSDRSAQASCRLAAEEFRFRLGYAREPFKIQTWLRQLPLSCLYSRQSRRVRGKLGTSHRAFIRRGQLHSKRKWDRLFFHLGGRWRLPWGQRFTRAWLCLFFFRLRLRLFRFWSQQRLQRLQFARG